MDSKPNIAFFVLDSVRYDHTSVSDYYRDTTPNIQRIANRDDGVSFDTAISHAKHTPKSVASILTGKYPAEHRLNYESNTLDDNIPTVAEALEKENYNTVCVTNNSWVSDETGLSRGFDDFVLLPKNPKQILRTFGVKETMSFLTKIRQHSAGFQRDLHRHSGAYLLSSLVEQKMNNLEKKDDPFFLYVHFNQPHRAYYPPLSWFDTYSDQFDMSKQEAGELSMDVHHNINKYVAYDCPFDEDEWRAIKALYDTEICYTDKFIGDIFDILQEKFDNTVTVITADHGEHFGERGALVHRYALDDALLHVPLVSSGIDIKSSDAPVQHTDMMKTLLKLADADARFVDGIDLRHKTREFAISQDNNSGLKNLHDINPEFDPTRFYPSADKRLPKRTALRTNSYRYVLADDGTNVLFEIPNEDKGEDISTSNPDITSKLESRLDTWFSNHENAQMREGNDNLNENISIRTKERLKNMGYIEDDF